MKKLKSQKIKENSQQKINEQSPLTELKNKSLFNRKTFKKERTITTKANSTMTESSKEDKKEFQTKKKIFKELTKINKSNLSMTYQEKSLNKTMDMDQVLIKKKKKKKHRNSTKVQNSLSQKHFNKLRASKSLKINLTKNKTLVNSLLNSNKTESSNNIMLGTDDMFIKTLLSKYMDGTDNIINEDSEAFNNIKNTADNDNISFFEEENENTGTNTVIETLDLKKENTSREINSNNNLNKMYNSKTINLNLNSTKIRKKENKTMIKLMNSEKNKIKNNLCNSFVNSPSRTKIERMSIGSSNKPNKFVCIKKKTNSNIMNKIKSFTKTKQNEEENKKVKSNVDKNDKEKLKRKIIYSAKLINNMNKSKQNTNNKKEKDNAEKKELIPLIAANLNLEVILENNKSKSNTFHHYLENTVSAKNKIVQKKQITSIDQNKNIINLFQKPEINITTTFTNNNNTENTISNTNTNNKNLRMNKTPKIRKKIKEKFIFNFNNKNNINNKIKNNGRKFSHHIKLDFSLENSVSSKTIINSKIFQKKIDDYLITRELGKGSYAVVKLGMDKNSKNKYAIKIYSKTCLIDPQLRNTVKNEINILKQIDNENVMKLYEVIDTQSHLYLVLEYINGINLLEIIKNEKNHFIKEPRAKKIFLKVVQGINYCHQINIYHRDIKLENILVLKDDSVKIIDFGFSIICKADTYQKLFCGTKSYMPPEIVKKEKYIACYSDIWSLGVLFYAMLFGVFPFKGKDEDELFEKIKEAKITFPEYNPISDKTKELFGKIFVVNPNMRISLDEMINYLKDEEG